MVTHGTEARALTESALLSLYSALNDATGPQDFLSHANAIITKKDNLLPLPVSLGTPDELNASGTKAVDVNNAPAVHQYIGEKDRANAADVRLWTYLAFATFRSYMELRWPLDVSEEDQDKWKRRAKDRWLMHSESVTRGRLIRHGIARLWWGAHLTYEPDEKPDPYVYTRELFKREDRLNAILDREVGALQNIRKAVLAYLVAAGSSATETHLRRLMQYLTLVYGYRDLGAMNYTDTEALVKAAAVRVAVRT